MICDRCGRLLNRATGRCVCEAYGGNAPAPVATTHPPPEAPRPVSAAAAFAVLDVSERPVRPARPAPPPPAPAPPPPPPLPSSAPGPLGAPVGTVSRVRMGRRRVDAVTYDNALVLAGRARGKKAAAARARLSAGQLAGLEESNRLIPGSAVDEVLVREDKVGGRACLKLTSGERVVLSWWGPHNRGVEAENLLADAFPGRVDQDDPAVVQRIFKAIAGLALVVAVMVAVVFAASSLLASEPPPPAPPAPPVTVPPAEQALRDQLGPACGPWMAFAEGVAAADRPNPAALRPVVDGLRGPFDAAAAASTDYTAARDEVVYLQDYARRPADAAARESVSRVGYAIRQVSQACAGALSSS